MSPELTILVINACFLGFGYFFVYPALPEKTWRTILPRDLAISVAALVVAGLLFAGSNLRFGLLFFDAPWWVFSILTLSLMELPLWEWFRRKHGISYDDLG